MEIIKITTADNISDNTYENICAGFREKYGKETQFEHIVNNGIIGGFIADVNGEIFDLSISAQLKKMKKEITG